MNLKTKIGNFLRKWADKLSPNLVYAPHVNLGIYSETMSRIEKVCHEQLISNNLYYGIADKEREALMNHIMQDIANQYGGILLNRGFIKFQQEHTDQGLRIRSYLGVVQLPY